MPEHHGLGKLIGADAYCTVGHHYQRGDRFGRLFPLAPLYIPAPSLREISKQGGPMDGGARASRTRTVDVGQVFFGQFVDHDVTLDVESSLSGVVNDASEIGNTRTPTLDLDCIYGQGPEASPFLYHATGDFTGVKLLTGKDGTAASQGPNLAKDDLQRTAHGTAIIGDPRNDENRIISQMQLAMIRFHNAVVDQLQPKYPLPTQRHELFEESRKLTTWHYQWVIVHDFLPAMCGAAVVEDILGNGRKFYCAEHDDPFIPVEFSVAAYRFGHSMIPQKIQIQKSKPSLLLFGADLGIGFRPVAARKEVVDWNELVTTSVRRSVQKAEKLDSKMASILLKLPFIPATDEQSLATRNLLRGQGFLLPSGESIAAAIGRSQTEINKVTRAAKSIATQAGVSLDAGTPLFLYLLLEAEKIGRESETNHFDKGEGLGPVGARIVAETMIGLMELDSRAYLGSNRAWDPSQGGGVDTLGAMLTFG